MDGMGAVKAFFDEQAKHYSGKYSLKNPYHHYFFLERLRLATANKDLKGADVLDIGAGTGALYDYLDEREKKVEYYACDISAAMLAKSQIPKDRRFVGRPQEIHFPVPAFDYIFLLGVTTYLPPGELESTLRFIAAHLKSGGQAVISFTHAGAVDYRLRRCLSAGVPRYWFPGRVLTASFSTYAYRPESVAGMFSPELELEHWKYFNFTCSITNYLAPRLSVRGAKWWSRHQAASALTPYLAADFMIFLKKRC